MSNPISNNIFRRLFSLLLFVISIFFFSVCKVHAVLEPTLVKDINVGSAGSYPINFVPFGNNFVFSANSVTNGREFWKSDGTTEGTVLIKDIFLGSASSHDYWKNPPVPIGSDIFFVLQMVQRGMSFGKVMELKLVQ